MFLTKVDSHFLEKRGGIGGERRAVPNVGNRRGGPPKTKETHFQEEPFRGEGESDRSIDSSRGGEKGVVVEEMAVPPPHS